MLLFFFLVYNLGYCVRVWEGQRWWLGVFLTDIQQPIKLSAVEKQTPNRDICFPEVGRKQQEPLSPALNKTSKTSTQQTAALLHRRTTSDFRKKKKATSGTSTIHLFPEPAISCQLPQELYMCVKLHTFSNDKRFCKKPKVYQFHTGFKLYLQYDTKIFMPLDMVLQVLPTQIKAFKDLSSELNVRPVQIR